MIDFSGQKKAAFFSLKNLYKNVFLGIKNNENKEFFVHIINDNLKDLMGEMEVNCFSLDGKYKF